jgi:hypothetical protein
MTGLLELKPAATPSTVLESEGMGGERDRRVLGSILGTMGMGEGVAAPDGHCCCLRSSWGAPLSRDREG